MAPLRVVRRYFFGDHPPLNEDERRLVLRAIVAIAIPMAVITFAVLLVGGAIAVHELRDRTQDNQKAIAQTDAVAKQAAALAVALNLERKSRENALAWQVYDECVENENQDAANVALYRKVKAVVAQNPPSSARDELLDQLTQTIDAREPEGEMDCKTPAASRPVAP